MWEKSYSSPLFHNDIFSPKYRICPLIDFFLSFCFSPHFFFSISNYKVIVKLRINSQLIFASSQQILRKQRVSRKLFLTFTLYFHPGKFAFFSPLCSKLENRILFILYIFIIHTLVTNVQMEINKIWENVSFKFSGLILVFYASVLFAKKYFYILKFKYRASAQHRILFVIVLSEKQTSRFVY